MRLREKLPAALLALWVGMCPAYGGTFHPASLMRVIDGDNVWLRLDVYLKMEVSDNYRLYGIDAPETRRHLAGCDEEVALANTVKAYLAGLLEAADGLMVQVMGEDKYGRPMVIIYADELEVNSHMIEQKMAVPYHGEKKVKTEWCGDAERR